MRTFENFDKIGKCPICGTNEDGDKIYEATQVHLKCIDLFIYKNKFNDGDALIAMKFNPKG